MEIEFEIIMITSIRLPTHHMKRRTDTIACKITDFAFRSIFSKPISTKATIKTINITTTTAATKATRKLFSYRYYSTTTRNYNSNSILPPGGLSTMTKTNNVTKLTNPQENLLESTDAFLFDVRIISVDLHNLY